jgi:hypothetical protein
MSTGQKSIVINPQERAVSQDINRLQSLGAKGIMEALRFLLDVDQGTDDVQAAGIATEQVTIGTLLRAEILGGLMVHVVNGSLQLGITDGYALMIDPDATPSTDDSPYKDVYDPGGIPVCTRTVGNVALAMTPNSSGSIRIDVIECQRIQDPNPETATRDIFNTATNLYTPTVVTKSTASALQYRVRAGTPGSGWPGFSPGWLPLAVASVPTGTTTNDTITFWDVRQLVSDRINGPVAIDLDLPRRTTLMYSGQWSGTAEASDVLLNGVVELSFGGRRVGGQLRGGTPGALDANAYLDISAAANQESGVSFTGSSFQLAYLYMVLPFGLPRWAMYSQTTSSPRLPRSPRGIPVLSLKPPSHVHGLPTAAINWPTATGFTGAIAETYAVCFGAIVCTTQGPQPPFSTIEGWTSVYGDPQLTIDTTPLAVPENQNWPAGTKKLRCQLGMTFAVTSTAALGVFNPEVIVTLAGGQSYTVSLNTVLINSGGTTGSFIVYSNFELELPNAYPNQTPQDYYFSFVLSGSPPGSITPPTSATLQILAFQM